MQNICFLAVPLLLANICGVPGAVSAERCTLGKLYDSEVVDIEKLAVQELSIFGLSSEGSRIEVFRSSTAIRLIKATLFGETSKSEFVFSTATDFETDIVVVRTVSYAAPISANQVEIAEETDSKFAVCEKELGSFPDASSFGPQLARARTVLKRVLAEID